MSGDAQRIVRGLGGHVLERVVGVRNTIWAIVRILLLSALFTAFLKTGFQAITRPPPPGRRGMCASTASRSTISGSQDHGLDDG